VHPDLRVCPEGEHAHLPLSTSMCTYVGAWSGLHDILYLPYLDKGFMYM
jgi:hypothetical protein